MSEFEPEEINNPEKHVFANRCALDFWKSQIKFI